MSEAICDPRYWARRLREAPHDQPHHAIFKCPRDRWERIEAKHREILAATIHPAASVLDAGCGWGRLLTLMPNNWFGDYLGLDLSPSFIEQARRFHRHRHFYVADLRKYLPNPSDGPRWTWGVLISIRPMIRRHLGGEAWEEIERNLRGHCSKLLYLEYDEDDPGSIE